MYILVVSYLLFPCQLLSLRKQRGPGLSLPLIVVCHILIGNSGANMSSTLPGPVAPVEDTVPDHSVAAVDIASSASSSRDADVDQPKTPSKNAIKRAAKAARFAAHKLERRAREKESRKEKRRLLSEKRAAGELDDEDVAESNRHKKKHKVNPVVQFHGKVVVDLGFDHLMSDKVSCQTMIGCNNTFSILRVIQFCPIFFLSLSDTCA